MSRRVLRCRHPACPERGGAILGRVTLDDGLALAPLVVRFRVYLDAKRVIIRCPSCGADREFRGTAVFSAERSATAER